MTGVFPESRDVPSGAAEADVLEQQVLAVPQEDEYVPGLAADGVLGGVVGDVAADPADYLDQQLDVPDDDDDGWR